MATEYVVDPVESVRGEMTRRIINAGIFTSAQIQRENAKAPTTLPYCRITIPQSGDYDFDSQVRFSKTLLVEFDVMTPILEHTQLAGQLASKIQNEFGFLSRTNRTIAMTGWTGASAVVSKYSRGTPSTEPDVNIYYLPVILYVKLTLLPDAKYEV